MKAPLLYLGLVALAAALFLLAPNIDLAVAGLFYQPHAGFPLSEWWLVRFVEQTIPWITRLIILIAVLGVGWLLFAGRPLWRR